LQIGFLNAPDLITVFVIAEDRKAALLRRKPQVEGMYSNPIGIQMYQLPNVQQTQPG
jgi:hypothetical protein